MKDRSLTLLLALGAFAAFYQFFIGPARRDEEQFSRPLSTEIRANGYFAVRQWLETEGIPVVELRHRYDWLLRAPGLPEAGNLLVTTIPQKRSMRRSEIASLNVWMKNGNAILVAAGIFDTPEWAVPEPDTLNQLYEIAGIVIREPSGDEGDPAVGEEEDKEPPPPAIVPLRRLDTPKRGVMRPNGDHPLVRGIDAVHAVSEFPAGKFVGHTLNQVLLSLMSDDESGEGALWLTWNHDSPVLVSGYGSIFTNKMLAHENNADLMANAVAEFLGPGGHVVFDDMHQGAVSFYDAEAFFGDPRLHATFWWIMALWFLWVLGSTRLPPPAARPSPVRERAFVTATGNFFARVLDRRRIGKRMFANFFNDQRRSLGLPPDGQPLWSWMRGFGAIPPGEIGRLEALYARVAAGRRVHLIDLHNRLQHLRKQMT